MLGLLWLLLIPLAWAIAAKLVFPERIHLAETGVKFLLGTVIMFAVYGMFAWQKMGDVEVLNGYVSGKERNEVSCSHSYKCMCYTSCSGSGSSRSCTEICQTCYDHPYDVDWDVYTTVGNLSIDRIDRQGVDEPPRWSQVVPGEPAALRHSYINYILAAPDSLFSKAVSPTTYAFPAYQHVFDYYRRDTVHVGGVNVPSAVRKELNDILRDRLKKLGAAKQVNINVVFTPAPRDYVAHLERVWAGGKKNDVTAVIGVKDYPKIDWADAFTFAGSKGNQELVIHLRDDLSALKVVEPVSIANTITTNIEKSFKRIPMAEFEYLKGDFSLSGGQWGWLIVIQVLYLLGATWFAVKNDIDAGGGRYNRLGRIRINNRWRR